MRSLAILLAVSLTPFALGCGGDEPTTPTTPGCTHLGIDYKDGETFPAGDGCNTCSCNPEGTLGVGCSQKACAAPDTITQDHCPALATWHNKELTHDPAGDAVCAAAGAPVCSIAQGTPTSGCPRTCYCTCFQKRCYSNGCSAQACATTNYQAD